jgi:hypothetical protein
VSIDAPEFDLWGMHSATRVKTARGHMVLRKDGRKRVQAQTILAPYRLRRFYHENASLSIHELEKVDRGTI